MHDATLALDKSRHLLPPKKQYKAKCPHQPPPYPILSLLSLNKHLHFSQPTPPLHIKLLIGK